MVEGQLAPPRSRLSGSGSEGRGQPRPLGGESRRLGRAVCRREAGGGGAAAAQVRGQSDAGWRGRPAGRGRWSAARRGPSLQPEGRTAAPGAARRPGRRQRAGRRRCPEPGPEAAAPAWGAIPGTKASTTRAGRGRGGAAATRGAGGAGAGAGAAGGACGGRRAAHPAQGSGPGPEAPAA